MGFQFSMQPLLFPRNINRFLFRKGMFYSFPWFDQMSKGLGGLDPFHLSILPIPVSRSDEDFSETLTLQEAKLLAGAVASR